MEGLTLMDYWLVLYRRRGILAVIVLSAIGFAFYLSSRITPIYEAKAIIFVPEEPSVVSYFSTDASKSIAPKPAIPATQEKSHAPYVGMLRSETVKRKVHEAYPQKSLHRLFLETDFEISNEFMIEIYVRDQDPKLAADVANAYIKALDELLLSNEISQVHAAIEQQLQETRGRLEAARQTLQTFQEREKIADLSQETAELVKQQSAFEMKIEDAKVGLKGTEQQISGLQRQLQREAALYVPSGLITTSPLVESLKKDLVDLEAAIGGGLSEQTARHPSVTRLQAQYDEKKRELEREINKIVGSQTKPTGSFYETLRQNLVNLLVEKVALEARTAALARTVAGIGGRLARLPEIKVKHDELVNDVTLYQKLVELLSVNLEEARAQTKRFARGAVVVDPAVVPDKPAFPIRWLNAVVAGMLGLLGGIFYCFFLDYIERAIAARRAKSFLASPAATVLLRRS
jgi:polysaccharide biosynthesis transport protein